MKHSMQNIGIKKFITDNKDKTFVVLVNSIGYSSGGRKPTTGYNYDMNIYESSDDDTWGEGFGYGIRFDNIDDIYLQTRYYSHYRVVLSILEDDNVLRYYDSSMKSFHTAKLILGEQLSIADLPCWKDPAFMLKAINDNPDNLKFNNGIIKITFEIGINAVKKEPKSLKYIPETTDRYDEICQEAIPKDWICIKLIANPSKKLYDLALDNHDIVFKFYPNEHKTYDMCLKMVRLHGLYIESVPEEFLSVEMCMEAVKQCGDAIRFILGVSRCTPKGCIREPPMKVYHMEADKKIYCDSKVCDHLHEIQKTAIMQKSSCFRYIKDPSYELQLLAVKLCAFNIGLIPMENQTEELCAEAIKAIPSISDEAKRERSCIGGAYWNFGFSDDVVDLCKYK
jgi:hypothetical protein